MLVIACNTASAHAIPALKEEFPSRSSESWSRRPGCQSRRRHEDRGHRHTVDHQQRGYEMTIRGLKPDVQIFSKPCPLFVPLVEEGWCDDEITEQVARGISDGS